MLTKIIALAMVAAMCYLMIRLGYVLYLGHKMRKDGTPSIEIARFNTREAYHAIMVLIPVIVITSILAELNG